MNSSAGMKSFLHANVTRADGSTDKFHSLEAFMAEFAKGSEDAIRAARDVFMTNLTAHHFDGDGKLKQVHQLGSGLTTNVGVNLLAQDPLWVAAATPFSTLSSLNFIVTGTGTTAAALTDYYVQTPISNANITGGTNGYTTGVITNGGNGSTNIWKNVCTVAYNATLAVTEWGITMSNAANFSGTATSTAAGSLTNTGATFTTAGNALKGWTVEAASTAINTPTTTAMGLITSNSGTVLTLAGGWVTLANAGASTPSGTTLYVAYPTLWDHKVFAAINVIAGDSIQYTYSLTCTSGG